MSKAPIRISPELFLSQFLEIALENAPELISRWPTACEYTACFMRKWIPSLADRLTLSCYEYSPYWSVDAILFEDFDKVHFPHQNYAKFISVAIEHENEARTSQIEMNKLQILNTPLKVLITYPNGSNGSKKLLAQYEQIVRDADRVFGDTETLRRQLVIFGYHKTGTTAIDWEGYTFVAGSFVPVEPTPQTTGQKPLLSAPE